MPKIIPNSIFPIRKPLRAPIIFKPSAQIQVRQYNPVYHEKDLLQGLTPYTAHADELVDLDASDLQSIDW
ncbi:hypothetical protein [Rappaport israeli]|uniref:hypothetical protein n=1 Tax=Rappaport israeli TaxID=1839807 RepID=UPI0009311D1A|nr:hypothetical protein [Rappaport israeli]